MSAFYKNIDNCLIDSQEITAPTYMLNMSNKSEFTFPHDGWYYFETEEEARTFFNLPKEDEGKLIMRTLSPRQLPNAFVVVLGQNDGINAWAKIFTSKVPMVIFWISQYLTGEFINLDDAGFIQAIKNLAIFSVVEGENPILTNQQAEQLLSVLDSFYQESIQHK